MLAKQALEPGLESITAETIHRLDRERALDLASDAFAAANNLEMIAKALFLKDPQSALKGLMGIKDPHEKLGATIDVALHYSFKKEYYYVHCIF